MKEKPVIREFFMDDEGLNKTIMYHYDKTIILYIQLQAEKNRKRKIGVITKSTRTIRIKRDRNLHLFKKAFSYGFNEYILSNAKRFDTIWLKDQFEEWKIPVKFILENGSYLNFKQQGFELQLFVRLVEIEQFVIPKDSKRRF